MQSPIDSEHGPEASVIYEDLIATHRIHGSLYTDPAVFADEMKRIFLDGWVFVGHESEIPEIGDWVTRQLGLEPVIMVRDEHGRVQVLANAAPIAAPCCAGRHGAADGGPFNAPIMAGSIPWTAS
jgi:hypothetical protein